MFYLLSVYSVLSLKSLNYCIERLRSYPLPFLRGKSLGNLTCNCIFKKALSTWSQHFFFRRIGLGWMSEFMYSVLVPGGRRKDSCKEIAVSKVSVFVQTGWGLGLKRLTTNLQNSFQAKFQGSNPILWLRSNASTTQVSTPRVNKNNNNNKFYWKLENN